MTLLEQIKADREAGTKGPWTEMHDHPDPATAASLANIRSEANECGYAADIAHVFGCDYIFDGRQEQKHNARRISRVPDMEEALLAAEELKAVLKGCIDTMSRPDKQLCCSGYHCGCYGATEYSQAIHYAELAIADYEKATGGQND